MSQQRIFHSLFGLMLATVVLACGVAPVATQAVPSPAPQMFGTFVAQTAAAAQTRTATFLPSPTRTATVTRTPSKTPTPATATPTFIFLLPSKTPTITLTPTLPTLAPIQGTRSVVRATQDARAQGFTGLEWTCGIQERTHPTVRPKEKFSIFVTLRNTGTKPWGINTVDFVYTGGYRHLGTRIDDLPRNVASGNTITLQVDFEAPKALQTYNSFWTLKVGRNAFCGVKLTFEVEN